MNMSMNNLKENLTDLRELLKEFKYTRHAIALLGVVLLFITVYALLGS